MRLHRVTMTIALVVFSLFASTSAGYAVWSANAATTGRVETGSVAVTQTGAAGLAVTYNVTTLVDTAPIIVTNTGTTTAPHTLQLSASGSSTLAQGVGVRTWVVPSAAACTAASTVPPQATTSSLANVPALASTLPPSGTAIYCIRTSITPAQQTTLASQSVTISSSVTSALGNWASAPAAQTAAQTVTDTAAPSVPTPTARTLKTSTTLTWPASTDNVGPTRYDVYRDGVLVGSTATTSFTNTGLTAGSTYSYTIRAADAAGNLSAASTPLTVKTVSVPTNTRMVLTNTANGRCLDGEGGGTRSGTSLIDWACHGNSNQSFSFAVSNTDYYVITAPYTAVLIISPALAWDVDPSGKYVGLYTANRQTKQEWQLVAVAPDVVQIVNRASSLCLQMGSATGDDVKTTLATCASIPQQTYSIAVR